MIIQGLWIGSRLSTMERLCVKSFIAHGHEFHLYTYGKVEGLPEGTLVRDALEIMPYINFSKTGTPSWGTWNASTVGFSDLFRTELLLKNGGWYVDMDTVCLKPFNFSEDYVFAAEAPLTEPIRVNTNVIKVPPHSEVMASMKKKYWDSDLKAKWPGVAPEVLTPILSELGMIGWVKPTSVFNPIAHWYVPKFITENPDYGEAYSIHWWHGGWAQRGYDTDTSYPPECLYERMKAKYL